MKDRNVFRILHVCKYLCLCIHHIYLLKYHYFGSQIGMLKFANFAKFLCQNSLILNIIKFPQ